MKRVVALTTVAGLLIAWGAWRVFAQAGGHREAAAELLRVSGAEMAHARLLEQMAEDLVSRRPDAKPSKAILLGFLQRHLAWRHVQPAFQIAYMEAFTEDELKELAAFYRTPTGRKAMAAMPQLARQGRAIVERRLAGREAELEILLLADAIERSAVRMSAEATDEPAGAP